MTQKLIKPRNRDHIKKYWLTYLVNNGDFSRFFWYSNIYFKTQTKSKLNLKELNIYDSTSFFRVFFLKNEVFYTKLKYSRVPQFDTSSGATASFISGFYGFLVCERFGFELIDSGDFLFVVLYLFVLVLLLAMLLEMLNTTTYFGNNLYQNIRTFK